MNSSTLFLLARLTIRLFSMFISIQNSNPETNMLELAKLQMAQLDLAMQKIDDLILGLTDILEAVQDENMAVKIKNTLQLTELVTSFQFRYN